MKTSKILLIMLLLAAGFGGGVGYQRWYGRKESPRPAARKILYYVDPMHPAYKSDHPGVAPDCGMKLVPVYADGGRVPPAEGAPSPKPANELEQVDASGQTLPMGTIRIAPDKQELIGVQFGQAGYTIANESIRAAGKAAVDETRVVRVHSRVEGWIEKVQVNFTGAEVRKGDPLLTLYSPEMLASQQEYLLALRARAMMRRGGAMDSAVANSETLVAASRRRLELWSLSLAQIQEVEDTGKALQSITLYAPADGIVMTRNSFPGQKVNPDTELYVIADLTRIWIMADVFEVDIPKIRVGQAAVVRMPYGGGESFRAVVNYIQPQVDPQTRTTKVRLEAPNPGLKLKPDMFLDVEFPLSSGPRLTVPADAVLDSGQRQTVFVDRGNGFLEPRQVEVGDRLGDRIVILGGLKAGERIVTSANFLIDSESQLKSALAGMGAHQHGAAQPSEQPVAPPVPLPKPTGEAVHKGAHPQ